MLLAGAANGFSQGWLLESHGQIKHLVVPIYLRYEPEPTAVLRADRIYSDYQRKGFFRIGALPLLVIEGLKVELRDPARLSPALAKASTHLAVSKESRKAVEARGFLLTFPFKETAQVCARSARIESGDAWQLTEGSLEGIGPAALRFSSASLTVRGPDAGRLSCDTTNGTITFNLPALLATQQGGHMPNSRSLTSSSQSRSTD